MVVGGQHGDRRAGLGQSVGVDEVDVRHVAQRALDELERHPPAAVGEVAQRRGLRPGVLDRLEDPPQHRRHHHGVGDPLVRGEAHPRAGLEGRQVHDATPGVERAQHRRDPRDVVRRHADQLRLRRLAAQELDARDDVGDQVPVAQHRRLGLRRRAAREQQHGDLLGVDEGVLPGHRLGDGRGELALRHDVVRSARPEPVHLVVVGDHEPAGDASEDARQLLVGGSIVHRRERHPRQRGPEQRHREHVGVHPEVADDLGPALLEVDGGPPGALEELGGGDAAVMGAEDDAPRVTLGRHLEQHGDVHEGLPPVSPTARSGVATPTTRLPAPVFTGISLRSFHDLHMRVQRYISRSRPVDGAGMPPRGPRGLDRRPVPQAFGGADTCGKSSSKVPLMIRLATSSLWSSNSSWRVFWVCPNVPSRWG